MQGMARRGIAQVAAHHGALLPRPLLLVCRAHAGAACRDPACRFHMHQRHCGGTWVKVKEPEGFGQKKKKGGCLPDRPAAGGLPACASSSCMRCNRTVSPPSGSACAAALQPVLNCLLPCRWEQGSSSGW